MAIKTKYENKEVANISKPFHCLQKKVFNIRLYIVTYSNMHKHTQHVD